MKIIAHHLAKRLSATTQEKWRDLLSMRRYQFYYFTESRWFRYGNLSMLMDSGLHCVNALARLLGAILFPLGMLYAKENTDSWNITKGEFARATDSLIALAEKQIVRLGPSEQPLIEDTASMMGID